MAFSALVIALVLLLNLGISALFGYQLWHIDTTSQELLTLTDTAVNYLRYNLNEVSATRDETDPLKVDIVFCADPDILCGNEQMRYVYYTALEMEKAFRDVIKVSTHDVLNDPSAVDAYLTSNYSTIRQDNIIISSGSEFRILALRDMYVYESVNDREPWAYDGEKMFSRAIVAVTRAKSPLCGLITNHDEVFQDAARAADYSRFVELIEFAGYDVFPIDLMKEEIPADCRLLISMDPQKDFVAPYDGNGISEIQRLNAYLGKSNTLMVFMDADSPTLPNLEDYLEEWGIAVGRYEADGITANLQAIDPMNALDSTGTRIIGEYETEGLGGSLLSSLIRYGQPKVVFDTVLPLAYSDVYQEAYMDANETTGTEAYTFASYNNNGINRLAYEMFSSGKDSFVRVRENGSFVKDANGEYLMPNNDGSYHLMMITAHNRPVGEGQGYTQVNEASYVCAAGSVAMARNEYLTTRAYGNSDALLSLFRIVGQEVVPSGVPMKLLSSTDASDTYCTPFAVTLSTTLLVLIPAVVATLAGTSLLLRRRYAH